MVNKIDTQFSKNINSAEVLPVMEHFYTIQGEGFNSGKPSYFVRLAGCDVGCVWCDVKESWDATKHPIMSLNDILNFCKNATSKNIVITGGEPCMYDLTFLCQTLKENEFKIWLETSGAHIIKGNFDWVCLSPKKFKNCLEENYSKANELKVVIFNKSDFAWAETHAAKVNASCKLYLQTEWDKRDLMTPLIVEYVKNNPKWQISVQTHKYMNIP